MADVIPRTVAGRDRAQMLLVAAFGVAVMLVALALILNTAIYTENIATRGSDISGGKDAIRFRAVTEGAMEGTVRYVNTHNNTTGGYSSLEESTKFAVWNYSNLSGRQQATDTIVSNVSVKDNSPSRGTHIYQGKNRSFTNEDDHINWTVAKETEGVRRFSVNATEGGLADHSCCDDSILGDVANNTFAVTFWDPDTSEEYRVIIHDDAANPQVVVRVNESSGDWGLCTHSYGPDDAAVINFTEATIDGDGCEALGRWTPIMDTDGGFNLAFNNTCAVDTLSDDECSSILGLTNQNDREYYINGTYSLTVNNTLSNTNVVPGTGEQTNPDARTAIYSMKVRLTYESKRLFFRSDIRIAPGEPDA